MLVQVLGNCGSSADMRFSSRAILPGENLATVKAKKRQRQITKEHAVIRVSSMRLCDGNECTLALNGASTVGVWVALVMSTI